MRDRPRVAFFDYHDVFEDFYPHYGVTQRAFATTWADTAFHRWLALIQREIGDVTWYMLSLRPELRGARNEPTGCRVEFLPSSWAHRALWRAFYLSDWPWRWGGATRLYTAAASYSALLSIPLLRSILRDRPDAVLIEDYASGRYEVLLALARALRIPLVAIHVGSSPAGYVGKAIKQWTIPRADWIFTEGTPELKRVRAGGVDRARSSLLRIAIDTSLYRPLARTAACAGVGLRPDRRYLLFMGRLQDSTKRVSAIIRAFQSMADDFPDVDLMITGDGPDRPMLEELAKTSRGGRVQFLGWVSSEARKIDLYNAAEALVLFSRSEGLPGVIAEAMACGIPVVSSRVGQIEDLVIPGQTGLLVRSGDESGLRRALVSILKKEVDPDMGPAARRLAETMVSQGAAVVALREAFQRLGVVRG